MLPILFDPETRFTRNAWGPLARLSRDLDRVLDPFFDLGVAGVCTPYRVDVWEDEDHVYLAADAPGLTKDDLEISVDQGVLTIAGQRKDESEREEGNYHIRERRFGRFERRFRLPDTVDADEVDASLKDGVLNITLKKREESRLRKIEVK